MGTLHSQFDYNSISFADFQLLFVSHFRRGQALDHHDSQMPGVKNFPRERLIVIQLWKGPLDDGDYSSRQELGLVLSGVVEPFELLLHLCTSPCNRVACHNL